MGLDLCILVLGEGDEDVLMDLVLTCLVMIFVYIYKVHYCGHS